MIKKKDMLTVKSRIQMLMMVANQNLDSLTPVLPTLAHSSFSCNHFQKLSVSLLPLPS